MGYLPSLGGKAAHLVSDLLNPVSGHEREPSSHHHHLPEAIEGQENLYDDDEEGGIPNGPDTSSFRAFLMSFMSASTSSDDSVETVPEQDLEMEYPTLTPVGKGNKERKGFLSRGKHSIGKIIVKAGRLGGFRQKPSHVVGTEIASQTEPVSCCLDLKGSTDCASNRKLPAMSEPSMLLSEMMRNALYPSLPVLVQGKSWMLVYSTWRHGISLSTLYRRSMLCAGDSLLIIGDKKGAVFGGLVEAPLRPIMQRKYQGTYNCFVFTNVAGRPVVYRPTGANNYFTFCSPEYLAMGGGGHFALYLDEDLLNGSSSTSETFNNPCLSLSREFEVKHVELWGFVSASEYDEMLTVCRTEKPGIWNLCPFMTFSAVDTLPGLVLMACAVL